MRDSPAGEVTFCFTDIEGSTAMLARVGRDVYATVLEWHRQILRRQWVSHAGTEISTQGDGFLVVFADAGLALRACAVAQDELAGEQWPPGAEIKVRMGLHTGIAHPESSGDYTALAVHQAADRGLRPRRPSGRFPGHG